MASALVATVVESVVVWAGVQASVKELVWVWPWSWGRSGKALLGAPRLSGEGVGWGWDAWPLLSPVRAVGAHEHEEK